MITAKGKFGDREIEAEVVTPGDWFGKTWLIEIGGGTNESHERNMTKDLAGLGSLPW